MNWKFEAIEKLKEYAARKNAITSIPDRVRNQSTASIAVWHMSLERDTKNYYSTIQGVISIV